MGHGVVTVNAHWPRLLLTLRPQNTSFNISKLQAACTYTTKRDSAMHGQWGMSTQWMTVWVSMENVIWTLV